MNDIKKLAKSSGLHGYQNVKAIYLEPELFSVENGLLTPTFKMKRLQIRDKNEKLIEDLYKTTAAPISKL